MPTSGATKSIAGWQDVWEFTKRQLPSVLTTGKFNFITIHYCYISGMAILLSVILYAIGDVPYVDALFFTSGSCTQSGLNTIDVNKIKTGQQVVLYLGAMFCNPIIIHSSVVFIRLYWFEKRFEDIVKEANALRRTKSKARTQTFNKDDAEAGYHEPIGGRVIKLIQSTGRRMSLKGHADKDHTVDEKETTGYGRRSSEDYPELRRAHSSRRNSGIEGVRLPGQMNTERHIQFLENQRNPKDDVVLHIPSPREFDRGGRPRNVEEQHESDLKPQVTRQHGDQDDTEDEPRRAGVATHLTFNEPEILRDRTRTGNLPPRLNVKRSATTGTNVTNQTFNAPQRTLTGNTLRRTNTGKTHESMPYLSFQGTVGRNSFFVGLSEEEREELGGIEYRALKTLALILIFYFFAYHLFGIITLTPWIWHTSYGEIVTSDGQGRTWWGIFTAASSFNDLGFTLTPDSMISFAGSTYVLLIMTFLIIIGNTGFPCMLRFMIWLLSTMTREGSGLWEELQFLLDHPRRCFTLLFPRSATWWLFAILVLLNGVDLLFFVVLDLNNTSVSDLTGWYKFLDGLFQAASTRTAGFAVVNLAALHPAIQVSYLIMMYISVFPIAISMRRTNVYEEKSLGIYAAPGEDEENENEPSYVGAHLRKQLSFDLWYIFLGLFIIAIVEGDRLENTNEYAFTTFSCLFEIVSAYGTVGLSLGYPTNNASFSAEFRTISKLVIISMQIRGRHRGLPYELDRAVLLPSESLHETERREAQRLLHRRPSLAMSMTSAVDGHIESSRFRPETGLASGNDANISPITSRDRRFTPHKSQNTSGAPMYADEHSPTGPARRGLGDAMYKMATVPHVLKEDLANRSSSSDS